MIVKPHIVAMMKETLPAFSLHSCPRSAYVFRRSVAGEPFDFVWFQRDSHAGALTVTLATTYNADWCGTYGGQPLGRVEGLAELHYRWHFWVALPGGGLPAGIEWYQYGPSEALLHNRLREISRHLRKYGVPFFRRSRAELLTDPLLQRALTEIHRRGPLTNEERHQLDLDMAEADWQGLPALTNPQFLAFRDTLQHCAREIRARGVTPGAISALAYSLLVAYPDRLPSIGESVADHSRGAKPCTR
jgi:hypothetical protein